MNLPYHLSCPTRAAELFRLKDGRLHIIRKGKIAPLMVGFEYALVENQFADYLEQLQLPQLKIVSSTIYDPTEKVDLRTHSELIIGHCFSTNMIHDLDLSGEKLFLMDKSYIFVSPQLKIQLENSGFKWLRFSQGLSEFA